MRMPSRAGRGARDIAPSLCTERGGASGAALQTTQASKGGGVGIDRRFQTPAFQYCNPFGGRMTP